LAVAAVVGALTFGASLNYVRSTPKLVGWNWDLTLPYSNEEQVDDATRDRVQRAMEHSPDVTAYSRAAIWSPFPGGRPLQLGPQRLSASFLALDGRASVGPSIVSGRKPSAPNEILLGTATLDDLGLHV